jgi:prepilin-type N-terminal cleavage/methylation domain-containing protein
VIEVKSKKGFTLIELMFVMVLLALMVIIAYPYILNAYLKAQKDTFLTESKAVYRKSVEKYASQLVNNKRLSTISNDIAEADLGYGDALQYCVHMTSDGFVKDIKVTNGKYYIEGLNDFLDKGTLETIKYGEFDKFVCNYVLNEDDIEVEPTLKEIKADEGYLTTIKVLCVGFVVIIVIGLFVSNKNRRTS